MPATLRRAEIFALDALMSRSNPMRFARLWIFVSLLMLPGAARAGDDLRLHLEKAESSYALGEYGEAAKEYEAAFRVKPQSALLYNAAQAYRLAGDKDRALQLFINYIRVYGDRVPNRREVEAMIEKLKNAPTGTVAGTSHTEPPAGSEKPAPPPDPVPPPPLVPVPSEPPRAGLDLTAPAPVPVTRRPLFWVALGGAVVVIASGIAVATIYASSAKDPMGNLNPIVFGR
jgi:tetratricopeptide (TPR) repeat protein